MLNGHLPRVIYHQVFFRIRRLFRALRRGMFPFTAHRDTFEWPLGIKPLRKVPSRHSLCFSTRLPFSAAHSTKGPMWGYSRPVLGAVDPLLEPFPRHLSPNIDNLCEKLTLRYPHEGPWVVAGRQPWENAKRQPLKRLQGILAGSQGQHLALTVLYVFQNLALTVLCAP